MDPNTPLVLAGARFAARTDAEQAYKTLWSTRNRRAFKHLSVAVLTKDDAGDLKVDRHNSSTEPMALSGAMLGAALVLLAPPAGVAVVAAGGGVGAGAGALVGYFWRALPKSKVKELSDLLDSGESGVVLVATNPQGIDVEQMLANAERCVVIETKVGELETAFGDALDQATREKSQRDQEKTPAAANTSVAG
jgi:uncharacterized membrane protein